MGRFRVITGIVVAILFFNISCLQVHAGGMDDFSILLLQALSNDGDTSAMTNLISHDGGVVYILGTDLDKIYLESCVKYPLPDTYDLDEDGVVSVDDLTKFFKTVDTSYLYTIDGSLDGVRDAKEQVYEMLLERFDVDDVSEISSCTLKTFLENYSFCVCLYSLVTGESINSVVNGELMYNTLTSRSDSSEDWYTVQGIFFDTYLLSSIDTCLNGKEFPRSQEDASDNWSEVTGNSQHQQTSSEVEDPLLVKDNASDWLNDLVNSGAKDDGTDLPDGSDLSYSDKMQLGIWVSQISMERSDSWFSALRIVRIIVGILSIVYAVLFFLFYWLDKVNNLIDVSLLGIISLGKFIASADDTVSTFKNKGSEPKLVTMKDVLFISGGFLLLGVLILSGALFKLVVLVIDKVNYLLGGK